VRIVSIRSIRRWPVRIRSAVLLVAFLAISSYINSEILDIDGSRFATPLIAAWTDFEIIEDQTEHLLQAAVPPLVQISDEWSLVSVWTDSGPGLSTQPRNPHVISRVSRTPGATHATSASADPV
jgi:hypothetical protein